MEVGAAGVTQEPVPFLVPDLVPNPKPEHVPTRYHGMEMIVLAVRVKQQLLDVVKQTAQVDYCVMYPNEEISKIQVICVSSEQSIKLDGLFQRHSKT